jgi:hypothetical protein
VVLRLRAKLGEEGFKDCNGYLYVGVAHLVVHLHCLLGELWVIVFELRVNLTVIGEEYVSLFHQVLWPQID